MLRATLAALKQARSSSGREVIPATRWCPSVAGGQTSPANLLKALPSALPNIVPAALTQVGDMVQAMNALASQLGLGTSGGGLAEQLNKELPALLLDVKESETELQVDIEAPGVTEKELELALNEEDYVLTVTVHKELAAEEGKEGREVHIRERAQGSASRSITLPFYVDIHKIQASLNHGVLHVTLPKLPAEEMSAIPGWKRVPITGGSGSKRKGKSKEGQHLEGGKQHEEGGHEEASLGEVTSSYEPIPESLAGEGSVGGKQSQAVGSKEAAGESGGGSGGRSGPVPQAEGHYNPGARAQSTGMGEKAGGPTAGQ